MNTQCIFCSALHIKPLCQQTLHYIKISETITRVSCIQALQYFSSFYTDIGFYYAERVVGLIEHAHELLYMLAAAKHFLSLRLAMPCFHFVFLC